MSPVSVRRPTASEEAECAGDGLGLPLVFLDDDDNDNGDEEEDFKSPSQDTFRRELDSQSLTF